MKKLSLVFLILLFTIQFSLAQSEGDIISIQFLSSVDKHQPGNTYPVAFKVDIMEPFHINSQTPSEDFLIPTTLTIDPVEGLEFGELKFPKADVKTFEFSETPLSVYEHTFYIFTDMTVAENLNPAKVNFNATFSYQACDNQTCRAPADIIFENMVDVVSPETPIQAANVDVFSQPAQPEKAAENT